MGSNLRFGLAVLAALVVTAGAQAQRASHFVPSLRQSFDFDQSWVLKAGDDPSAAQPVFDDHAWTRVTLPYAFNQSEAFARDIHKLSTGITWYRKHFRAPAGARHVFLEFQGVRQAAEVWVNGVEIGLSENGVMAFGFDITKALKSGDNVIAVRVDNDWKYRERASNAAYQWNDTNFYANYGGINKPVRLHATGDVYQTLPLYSNLGTTGAYIWADAFDIAGQTATVHAETEVKNETSAAREIAYTAILRDLDGKVVATLDGGSANLKPGETVTLKASAKLKGLHFWSWGYGYLYTVTTVLKDKSGKVLDAVDTKTGFRKTAFDHGVFTLNDRVLQLKGYAQRTTDEWPAIGLSVPPWVSDFTNGLITGSNGNLVRWMHVTPSKQQVESADRLGLLTIMPAGDSEGDVSDRRWEQRLSVMRDAIIYNRNDPAVIFYESGNRGISETHMVAMKALRDRYDPHGGRASGSREMLDSGSAEYGGEMLYINKSAGKPLFAHEYSRDEAARAYQDDATPPFHKDAPDYNRNGETMAVEDVRRWWDYYEQRPGAGERVSAGGVKIGFTDSNSHFRGDNNYRRSGVVDAVRLPKDAWYVHQVMWDGWVNSDVPRSYIIGHWNYAPGTVKPVYVVSNGDSVELFLNGKSLGKGEKSSGFLFTFPKITWQEGELKARATYGDGRSSEYVLRTAGVPVALRLTPHNGPRGFVADGKDLLLVDVEVVDKNGQRVPTAFNPVQFHLRGAAGWLGGIAQVEGPNDPAKKASENGILATTLPVELGVNRVLLRAATKSGKVHLSATAEGLKAAELDLVAKPVLVAKDGLSTEFAEDFQPSDLSRGPTPLTPSFRPFLHTVKVIGITAGSNGKDAAKSHDDNEVTAWSSDGAPDKAWVQYDFAEVESPSVLSLRLTGWRLRTYPIRVTLDGKVVFEGVTPKSLGYVNLPLASARGKHLRITLTGATEDRDAFGKIVELKDNRIAQSVGADQVAPGWRLSIAEADILASVP